MYLGEKLKRKAIRLGVAGAIAALSLSAVAVPTHAYAPNDDPCTRVIDFSKNCYTPDGVGYPVSLDGRTIISSGPPVIAGAPRVGNTLTVFEPSWEPSDVKLAHQWLRNDVPILGATGTSYRLAAADLGKMISVNTTPSKPGLRADSHRSKATEPIQAATGTAPTVAAPATIGDLGRPEVGSQLYYYTKPGMWNTPGTALYYQWLRNGVVVPGATGPGYRVTAADLGKKLSVRVIGVAPGYNPATRTSASTVPAFSDSPGAVITGRAEPGQTLTAVQQPWTSGTPLTFKYQWLREGTPIPGAAAAKYKVTSADLGKDLIVRTKAFTSGFMAGMAAGTADSAPVTVAVPGALTPLKNTVKPVLTGALTVDRALTVTAGTWSEVPEKLTISYQWFRNGVLIPDATLNEYTPVAAEVGNNFSVTVSAARPGFHTATVTVTAARPIALGDPYMLRSSRFWGNPVVGVVFNASSPQWSQDGVDDAFQWLRNGAPIAGAADWRYTPVTSDLGKKLSVKITSSKAGKVFKIQEIKAYSPVTAKALTATGSTVIGQAIVGSTLTAKPGAWTTGTLLKYQWIRNGSVIKGATAATYKLTAADRGAYIAVETDGSLPGYITARSISPGVTVR